LVPDQTHTNDKIPCFLYIGKRVKYRPLTTKRRRGNKNRQFPPEYEHFEGVKSCSKTFVFEAFGMAFPSYEEYLSSNSP
jgi:hypothetical protein